jgi:hypothetical protein
MFVSTSRNIRWDGSLMMFIFWHSNNGIRHYSTGHTSQTVNPTYHGTYVSIVNLLHRSMSITIYY